MTLLSTNMDVRTTRSRLLGTKPDAADGNDVRSRSRMARERIATPIEPRQKKALTP